eukprot:508270_1
MGQIFIKNEHSRYNKNDIANISWTSISQETMYSTESFSDLRGCHRNSMFTENGKEHVINIKKDKREKVSFPDTNSKHINILIVKTGEGSIPRKHDGVEIEYIAYLGDSDDERKQFIKHRGCVMLGYKQNIIGLEQALKKMTVGSTVKLWIPSTLGYGVNGCKLVPPNTNLFFVLKLLSIVD